MGERISASDGSSALSPSCTRCSLSNLCLPLAVSHEEIDRLENIVQQGRTLDKGEHIFQQYLPFRSCFAVRSGAIKTYISNSEGSEQITGFYLPGEIIGLDSVNTENYSCSAQALERTSVCEIPFSKVDELAAKIPSLQHHFFHLMSQEIQDSQQLSVLLSRYSADERIVSLLLSLSSRYRRRRLSPTKFRLPMSRGDIGNYLGLAVETVSRILSRLNQEKLIELNGREIVLNDIEGLQRLLNRAPGCGGYGSD